MASRWGTHLQQSLQPRGVEEVVQEADAIHVPDVEQIQLLQHKSQDSGKT